MVALGVALVATLLVRRRVVGPLETLRQGVERIRKGDLTARLDLKTGDEIEILAEEFNDMAAHLPSMANRRSLHNISLRLYPRRIKTAF